MQSKIIVWAAAVALLTGCMNMDAPFAPENLNRLTVTAVYPAGFDSRGGATVTIENIAGGVSYSIETGADAQVTVTLPGGIYRVSVSDRDGLDVFNGNKDRVVVSGQDVSVSLDLIHSRAGLLVIKEIYCGGCPKTPEQGTYQSDQYVIVHNNSDVITYLDGLCLGSVAPYNSNANNAWTAADGTLPDFLPILDAIVRVPGNGTSFPLDPGQDAVIVLRGAIDHAATYPMSVNLNKPDYFVLYNPTYFYNQTYHPAPGNLIQSERYLDVVIKTGQSNAYTMSLNSPAFVIFQPQNVDIRDWVLQPGVVRNTPGSTIQMATIPPEWVIDGVEVFNGSSSGNHKRLLSSIDAGFVVLSETYKGHTLMRKPNLEASAQKGYEVLADSNNSSNDLYERETQSLHE